MLAQNDKNSGSSAVNKSGITWNNISTSNFEKKDESKSQKSDKTTSWLKSLSQKIEMDPFLHVNCYY